MTSRLLAILCLLTGLTASLFGQTVIYGRCVGVTDGDTIKVLGPGNQLSRIRVSWIDAPEIGQAYGYRAKQAMSDLVFGRDVELHTQGLDRYGRTLALVYVDGVDAGLELIRLGMAWPYYHYLVEAEPGLQASYLAAADTAKASHLGLWSQTEPTPPWQWRQQRRDADKGWVEAHGGE